MEWMILPLKRYAEFSGRSRRQEFWMFMLGVFLLYFVLMIVAMILGVGAGFASARASNGAAGGMIGMFASMGILVVVFGLVWLALLIPSIAVAVRRLHDTDRSGWWLLIYIVPYVLSMVFKTMALSANSNGIAVLGSLMSVIGLVAAIVLIVFYCLPGTPGPNRFGPDPLGSTADLAETFR